MLTIGITGTIGSGKGALVEFLQAKGFEHFSARTFLTQELEKRGLEVNRPSMTAFANDLRQKGGPGAMISLLVARAKASGKNGIVESIRTLGEVETFKREAVNPIFLAVDAKPKIRYERILKRGSALDNITYEQFLSDDAKEMSSPEIWKGNIAGCIKLADYVFHNDGSKEEFLQEVEREFVKLKLG